jgi:6-phosphogluconolactonase (cycloisomerase 2 family)
LFGVYLFLGSWFFAFAQTSSSNVPRQAGFLYASSQQQGNIPELAIEPQSGKLKLLSFQGNQGSIWPNIVNTPNGRYLYGGTAPFQGYVVTRNIGHLMAIPNMPTVTVDQLAANATGRYLLVSDTSSNLLSYSIDQTSGALTLVDTVANGSAPKAPLITDSTGKFVYVGFANSIAAYALDLSSGKLTAIPGSPFPSGANSLFAVSRQHLYAMNFDQTISGFTVDETTGALSAITGSPWSNPNQQGIAADPVHNLVFTTNTDFFQGDTQNVVTLFAVNSKGSLSLVGSFGQGYIFDPYAVLADPSGSFLYVSDLSQNSCAFDACVGAVASFQIDVTTHSLNFVGNVCASCDPYDNTEGLALGR